MPGGDAYKNNLRTTSEQPCVPDRNATSFGRCRQHHCRRCTAQPPVDEPPIWESFAGLSTPCRTVYSRSTLFRTMHTATHLPPPGLPNLSVIRLLVNQYSRGRLSIQRQRYRTTREQHRNNTVGVPAPFFYICINVSGNRKHGAPMIMHAWRWVACMHGGG